TSGKDGLVHLDADASQVAAVASLTARASGSRRMDGELKDGAVSLRASWPMPGSLWVNMKARVTGSHRGFPTVHLRVGRITLPAPVARWVFEVSRSRLEKRGIDVPPLDELVRQISVTNDSLTADLDLPTASALAHSLVRSVGSPVDGGLVAKIYCRL